MIRIKVFVMFDSECCTWNIMNQDRYCIFFGTAEDIDDWLVENKADYEECAEGELTQHNSKVA